MWISPKALCVCFAVPACLSPRCNVLLSRSCQMSFLGKWLFHVLVMSWANVSTYAKSWGALFVGVSMVAGVRRLDSFEMDNFFLLSCTLTIVVCAVPLRALPRRSISAGGHAGRPRGGAAFPSQCQWFAVVRGLRVCAGPGYNRPQFTARR